MHACCETAADSAKIGEQRIQHRPVPAVPAQCTGTGAGDDGNGSSRGLNAESCYHHGRTARKVFSKTTIFRNAKSHLQKDGFLVSNYPNYPQTT